MNTSKDLIVRLLHLLPIKVLKAHFGIRKGTVDDVVDQILKVSSPRTAVINSTFINYHYTRQNIYLFESSKTLASAIINSSFPYIVEKDLTTPGEYSFLCLPQVKYSVYLSKPTIDREDIKFYQPVMVKIQGKKIFISITKLKPNVDTYFPGNRDPKVASVDRKDEDTLVDIVNFFNRHCTLTPIDFNKGLKKIWEADEIDCHKITSRNRHSSDLVTMNGSLTFKQKYPQEYQEIKKAPIGASHWKYLIADNYLCAAFTADPEKGTIGITSSAKTSNQVNNVITKILANN